MLIFVTDCWKNQRMFNKAVDNYAHVLEFVSDWCNTQKMRNKADDTDLSAIQFVPSCYKTHEICVKAADTCPFVSDQCSKWVITLLPEILLC